MEVCFEAFAMKGNMLALKAGVILVAPCPKISNYCERFVMR
jgi:large-conductance mechanosensitive channel